MDRPSEVITGQADLAAIETGWRELTAQDADSSYFVTPDWVLSWHETLGEGCCAEVAVWRATDGVIEAVVPLLHERHRLHRFLPVGVSCPTNLGSGLGSADHCGWAATPSRRPVVRSWLAERARSGLLLRNLDPACSAWSVPGAAVMVERTACPRLAIPDDPESAGSAKFRKKLRWYARKVAAAGVSFRWVPAGSVTASLVTDLLRLHGARARAIGRRTTFTERRRGLHTKLAARGRPGCGPAAVVGERDGAVVAVLYGFRWKSTFAYYQSGWDPALAPLSLGTVLVAEAIKLAAADGITIFDFLRGGEDYKYRFGASDRHDETWLVPHALAGRFLEVRHRLVSRNG